MTETLQNYENTHEIAETTNTNEIKNTAIEEALQQKMPNNEERQTFFLNIFQQPQIHDFFSPEETIAYIKECPLGSQYRTLKSKTPEEQTTIVREDMDIFIKNTTGSLKEIIVTNNILSEQVDQTSEQVDQTSEQVDQTSEQVDQTSEQVDQTIQGIEQTKNIKEAREATKQSYDNLDEEYKITNEQLAEQKADIPQDIITQVTEKTQGTELSTDDYLKFYLTANTNKDALQGTEFMTNYEALNDLLGIAPEKVTPRSLSTNPNEANAVVTTNPSLKNYSTNSKTLNKIDIPGFPIFTNIADEFDFYIKFVTDPKVKTSLQDQEETITTYNPETADESSKKAYQEYQEALKNIQEKLPERTKTISKQRVLGSCITGLARYFDTTTLNQENFADNFDINTQTGFSIDKGQSKYDEGTDDVLSIQGKINGNNIGFHYNLDNPESQLKADDHLHIDATSNLFSLGVENGGQKQLGVKLPSIGRLTEQTQRIIDNNFTDILTKAENMEDVEATLKQKISDELSKNYGQEALVKKRVARDIKKNITTQTLQNTFIPSPVLAELNRDKKIDTTNEKRVRNILNIRDKTTENMRSDQLYTLRLLTTRLDTLINKNKYPNLEPKRTTLLNNIQNEKTAVNYDQQRGKSTLKLFNKFSKNDKINIEDLTTFVNRLEKQENIADNMSKFSPDFQTTEDHEDADGLLKNLA